MRYPSAVPWSWLLMPAVRGGLGWLSDRVLLGAEFGA
jgi:hypothetical protein